MTQGKRPEPGAAVAARRRLLVAALGTVTVDYAEKAGITDEDHPREHNDLHDLALAARDYVRTIDALAPERQPRGWQS